MSKILLVGGTSAGHLAPMVAVAEALKVLEPNADISAVCSEKESDGAFLRMENIRFRTLPVLRRSLLLPITFIRALKQSGCILRDEKPDVIFSKGSSISVPLCLRARLKNIPVVLHESDAVMGLANNIVGLNASKLCFGYKNVAGCWLRRCSLNERSSNEQRATNDRCLFTGNPVRSRIVQGKKEEALKITGLGGTTPILLVMGGSQGATAINEAVIANLDDLLHTVDIIHLTGAGKKGAEPRPGYYATEFGSDVLPHFYAAATLAVSRAGAGSIAELSACGIPSILIPIRGLAADHQVKNAAGAAESGSAIVLPQEELAVALPDLVRSLLADPKRMETMREKARYAASPEAARLIAETVVLSVARPRAGQ